MNINMNHILFAERIWMLEFKAFSSIVYNSCKIL